MKLERTPAPRLALNQQEAAQALGVSVNTFVRRIRPELKRVYLGRRCFYPVRELQRWLDKNARRPPD
jgi:hypothetical protein